MAKTETDDPEVEETTTEAPDPIATDDAESYDEVHAKAAYNRAVMGPEASDGTIVSSGTEFPVEPGPGPEDNEALDNATGGALSAAAETGTAWPEPPTAEQFATNEIEAAKNIGIYPVGEPVEGEEGAEDDGEFDPGDHTVGEVQDYLDAHPEEEERVLAAEAAGKNRSSIVS